MGAPFLPRDLVDIAPDDGYWDNTDDRANGDTPPAAVGDNSCDAVMDLAIDVRRDAAVLARLAMLLRVPTLPCRAASAMRWARARRRLSAAVVCIRSCNISLSVFAIAAVSSDRLATKSRVGLPVRTTLGRPLTPCVGGDGRTVRGPPLFSVLTASASNSSVFRGACKPYGHVPR